MKDMSARPSWHFSEVPDGAGHCGGAPLTGPARCILLGDSSPVTWRAAVGSAPHLTGFSSRRLTDCGFSASCGNF